MKKKILIGLCALILIFFGGAYIFMRSSYFTGRIRVMVESKLEERLEREVSIGKISGNIFGNINVTDVSIAKEEKLSDGKLIDITRIKARYSLLSLLKWKLVIKSVSIIRPRIWLERDAEGKLNVPELATTEDKDKDKEKDSRFSVVVSSIDLLSGTVVFNDKKNSISATLMGLNGELKGFGSKAGYSGEVKVQNMDTSIRGVSKIISDIEVVFNTPEQEMIALDLQLRLGGSHLNASAEVFTGDTVKVYAEIGSTLSLKDIKEFVATPAPRLDGIAEIDGVISGTIPDINVECVVSIPTMNVNDLEVRNVDMEVDLTQNSVNLTYLSAELTDGGVRLSGKVQRDDGELGEYSAELKMKHLDMGKIMTAINDAGAPVSGYLYGEISASGTGTSLKNIDLDGQLSVSDAQWQRRESAAIPMGKMEAIVSVKGESIALDVFRGKAHAEFRGILDEDAGLVLKTEMDIPDVEEITSLLTSSPPIRGRGHISAETSMNIAHPRFRARMGLPPIDSHLSITQAIADLRGWVKVNMPDLRFATGNDGEEAQIGSLTGKIDLRDDHIKTDDMLLQLGDSKLLTKAEIQLKEDSNHEIDATFVIDPVQVEDYAPLMGIQRLKGTPMQVSGGLVTGKLEIHGNITDINGGGEISITGLSVGGRDIERISVPIEMESNVLNIPDLVVSSLGEEIRVTCSLTPSGEYDMKLDSSLIELATLSPDVPPVSGTAQVSISGSGNIDSPSLKSTLTLETLRYENEDFGSGKLTFTLKDKKAHADIFLSDESFVAIVDGNTQHPFPFSAIIQMGNINLEPALNLAGLGDKIDLSVTGVIDVDGEAANPMNSVMDATLQTVFLDLQEYRWKNNGPIGLKFSNGKFRIDSLRMKGAGGMFSMNGEFDTTGAMDVSATVRDLDLAVASKLLELPKPIAGRLNCKLDVNGELTAPSVEIKLDASGIVYEQLNIDNISALLSYTSGSARIEESTLKAFGGAAELRVEMPMDLDLRNPPTPDQLMENSIYVFLDADNIDLSFIPLINPEVSEAGGELSDVHLKVTGPIKRLKISGSLKLKDAHFQSDSLPTHIENVNGILSLASAEHIIYEPTAKETTRAIEYEASLELGWSMDGGRYDALLKVMDTGSWALNTWHQKLEIEEPAAVVAQPTFQLDLEIRDGQLETIMKAAPEAKIPPIDGSFSGKVNISGEIGPWVNESKDLLAIMDAPVRGDVVMSSLDLSIDEHIVKNDGEIRASLMDGKLEISDLELTVLSPSAEVSSTETELSFQTGSVSISGRLNKDKTLEIFASGERLHPGLFSSLSESTRLEGGELAFETKASGRTDSPVMEFSLTVKGLKLPISSVNGNTKIDTLQCEARYENESVTIREFHIDSFNNQLDVNGDLPVRLSLMPVIVEPLDSEMDIVFTMDRFDLSFLNYFTDKVTEAKGVLRADDVKMRGNMKAPLLTGNLHLSDASFRLMVDSTMPVQEDAAGEPQPLDVENVSMDIDIENGELVTGNMSFEVGEGLYEAHGKVEIGQPLRPEQFDFTFKASPASIDPFVRLVSSERASLVSGEIEFNGQLEGDARDFQGKSVLDILRTISGKIEIPEGGVRIDAVDHRITNPGKIEAKLNNGIIDLDSLKLIDKTDTGDRSSTIAAMGSWNIDGEKSFNATLNLDMGLVSKLLRQEDFMSGWLVFKLKARGDEVEIFWPPDSASYTETFAIGHAPIDKFQGRLKYQNQELNVEEVLMSSGRNHAAFSGNIPMTGEKMDLRLDAQLNDMGILSFVNRDITESSGRGVISATITGDMKKVIAGEEPVRFVGFCRFSDLNANFYESNINFEGLTADVGFDFGRQGTTGFITINELRGKMNDGEFYLNAGRGQPPGAEITWQKKTGYRIGALSDIPMTLVNCSLMQPAVFSILFGGELVLKGRFDAPIITGDITISEGAYIESLNSFAQRLFSSRDIGFKAFLDYPLVQDLELNVNVQIPGSMTMKNSIVDVEAKAFAVISGSLANPMIFARGQVVEGTISYFGQEFEIKEGVVTNESGINPEYKIKAETQITNTEDIDIDMPQGSILTIMMEWEGALNRTALPHLSASGGGVGRGRQKLTDTDIISILTLGTTPEAFLEKGLSGSSPLLIAPATSIIERRAERALALKEVQIHIDLDSAKENRLVIAREVFGQISLLVDVSYGGDRWIGLQRDMGKHFTIEGKMNMAGSQSSNSNNWSFDLKAKRDFP